MGETVTGHKADLIAKALAALTKAKDMLQINPHDTRFSVFLQYIAQENGGTLHAGYLIAYNFRYKRGSPPKAVAVAAVVKSAEQFKQNKSIPASSVSKGALTASRPFENVTYSNSPFNEFSSRLYTKVIDGRQGMMVINDFVLNPKTCDSLSSHRIKLYMGNPMNTMPFGMAKVVDVFFSDSCRITVNGNAIQESAIIPNKKKVWACVPPDITDLLHTKPGIANKIEIRFATMIPKCMVTIELVKVISPEKRVEIICEKHRHPKSQVLEEKKKSFLADDDIVATSEAITLRDPILQVKINKPGRSISCKHTQCFDLDTFFSMNERSNTFICPICNTRIKWENIILDEYFEEILKMAANQDDIDTIEIHPDGSWSLPGTEILKGNDMIKKELPSLQDEDIMIIDSDNEAEPLNFGYHPPTLSMTPALPIPALLNYLSTDPVSASLPRVQATSVEQDNLLTYNPPALTSTFIAATEIQSREENLAPDENVIDLTLSSDDEDTPIGATFGRNLAVNVSNIFNQHASNQIQPAKLQVISENNCQTAGSSADQAEGVFGAQERQNEPDNSSAEAMEKALDEALVQLDAPAVIQNTEAYTQAIATELPQILRNDIESLLRPSSRPIDPSPPQPIEPIVMTDMESLLELSSRPIDPSLFQPIESEHPQVVQDLLSFERDKDLDISSAPSPTVMERSPQRDRLADNFFGIQPRVLEANTQAIGTEPPQIVRTDMQSILQPSSKPIDPSPSQPIESEHPQTLQDLLSFEMGKDLGISSAPSPTLMERSSQRDRLADNVSVGSASAAIDPVRNLIQRSPQSRIEDRVTFEDREVDELLSSIPDPIFPRNSEASSPNPQKKSYSRKKQQVIYSSSIDVSIPSSQNDESDEDLDMFLSSVPDEMLGNSNEDSRAHNTKTASTEEHTNYSLDVIVSNQGGSEDPIVHAPTSSRTDDCVLTPSPYNSDDDNYESLTAKENRDAPNVYSDKNQLVNHKSRSTSEVRIDKTWTAQDEDALRMVAESIFAEMDAYNRIQTKRKRDLPDI